MPKSKQPQTAQGQDITVRPTWPQIWPNIPSLNLEMDDDVVIGVSPISLIRVYGKPGVGKTLFGLRAIARPPQFPYPPVILWDYEKSSTQYRSQYAIEYHDMSDWPEGHANAGKAAPKPVDIFKMWLEQMRGIEPGQFAIAIIDPAEDWETGLYDYVMANPSLFGHTANQYVKFDKPTGIFYGDMKDFQKQVLIELANKVQTIVVVNHLRQQYNGSQPVQGKFEPKGSDTLRKLSTVEVWLMPPTKGVGAPSGRIMRSRLNITDWANMDDFGVPELKPLLPLYIPEFTAVTLRDYLANPREQFTEAEMQNTDPSTLALSESERLSLQALIATEQNAQAKLAAEAAILAQKEAMTLELLASGVFKDRAEIGFVAGQLRGKGVVFTAETAAEYSAALKEQAETNKANAAAAAFALATATEETA